MPPGPSICCYLADHGTAIDADSPLWHSRLPVSRHPDPRIEHTSIQQTFSYGDYFTAALIFLERNRFRNLRAALSKSLNYEIVIEDLDRIHIHLEKHGAFYHPSRIETIFKNNRRRANLVLNLAVSESGRQTILREYQLLARLHQKINLPYIPAVYGFDTVALENDRFRVSMFIGEWFEGFFEFHLSSDPSDRTGSHPMMAWDAEKGPVEIPKPMTPLIYEKTAEILTLYYDPGTFEQIHPWSHAAGDFIVRQRENDLDLRLISVRRYAPMVNDDEKDARAILDALVVFLINLSLLNRLDRLDGVGDLAWAGEAAVNGTLRGFFKGLEQIDTPTLFSDTLPRFFKPYLMARSENELLEIGHALLHRHPPHAPESSFMKAHLTDHIRCLHHMLRPGMNG